MPDDLSGPAQQTRVPRGQVTMVVGNMLLLEPRVAWISIVLDSAPNTADTFEITPFTEKPF